MVFLIYAGKLWNYIDTFYRMIKKFMRVFQIKKKYEGRDLCRAAWIFLIPYKFLKTREKTFRFHSIFAAFMFFFDLKNAHEFLVHPVYNKKLSWTVSFNEIVLLFLDNFRHGLTCKNFFTHYFLVYLRLFSEEKY